MQTDLMHKIARVYCSGCHIYVEKTQSCCYVDGSGHDTYCPASLSKAKQVMELIYQNKENNNG